MLKEEINDKDDLAQLKSDEFTSKNNELQSKITEMKESHE